MSSGGDGAVVRPKFPRAAEEPAPKAPRTARTGELAPPSLNQIAVLDWLRRWPGVRLSERGRWSASWASESARLHMLATAAHLFGFTPAEGAAGKDGWGTFDFTPRCGSVTMKALRSRGLLDPEPDGKKTCFALSAAGREALLRFCFRLAGFVPVKAGARQSRPIKPSAGLLKRYGGPRAAESHMKFHEMQAAYHARIAERLRASLDLYEGSEEQRRDEWAARGKGSRR